MEQKENIEKQKIKKKLDEKQKIQNERMKQKYFDYYDDIKSHTHDVYDW